MKDHPSAVKARHEQITRWLSQEGRLDVVDVADRLSVAQETVRRDLRALESHGRLQRVHGGAVQIDANPFSSLTPPAVEDPSCLATALVLWQDLPRSGTLLLGTGELCLALAQTMALDPALAPGLTVVTNSLDAATTLARLSQLSVYNLGGTVSPTTRAQEGDWALQELHRLHVDVAVVCPAGVSVAAGLGQDTTAAAAISQAEVAAADRVIATARTEQVGRAAFVRFAGLDEVDRLVLCGSSSAAAVSKLREAGVTVTTVDESGNETLMPDAVVTSIRQDRRQP